MENNANSKGNVTGFFILASILIVLDQITKIWIKNHFGVTHTPDSLRIAVFENIEIIGDFLQFTYVENEGMAFGISFGAGKIILSLFSVIASIALSWYLLKIKDYSVWVKLGVSLILAGAVGNLIDRVFYGVFFDYAPIFYGRVIDFVQVDIPDISLGFINYSHFPIFNVADSCVTVGVIFLILFHKYIPTFSEITVSKDSEKNTEIEDETMNAGQSE